MPRGPVLTGNVDVGILPHPPPSTRWWLSMLAYWCRRTDLPPLAPYCRPPLDDNAQELGMGETSYLTSPESGLPASNTRGLQ